MFYKYRAVSIVSKGSEDPHMGSSHVGERLSITGKRFHFLVHISYPPGNIPSSFQGLKAQFGQDGSMSS